MHTINSSVTKRSKTSRASQVRGLALLLAFGVTSAVATTIPCPGVEDATAFSSKPLSERPKLAKMIEHGYMPSLNLATSPKLVANRRDPGNPVRSHEGFVDRPFRRINDESTCSEKTIGCQFPLPIDCRSYSAASFGPGRGRLPEIQFGLEAAIENRYQYPPVDSVYNPSYAQWEQAVAEFLPSGKDCGQTKKVEIMAQSHSCSINAICQDLDEKFLADLLALPVNRSIIEEVASVKAAGTETGDFLDPYRAFNQKWGFGSITKFSFGTRDVLLTIPDSNQTVSLGRLGGLGNFDSDGSHYTEEDCLDPAPSQIYYKGWDEILKDEFFIYPQNYNDIPNLDQISDNFGLLADEYWNVIGDTVRNNFTDIECDIFADTPTEGPSTVSPSSRISTQSPTAAPTLRIESLSAMPSVTNVPTITPELGTSESPSDTPSSQQPSSSDAPVVTSSSPRTFASISFLFVIMVASAV